MPLLEPNPSMLAPFARSGSQSHPPPQKLLDPPMHNKKQQHREVFIEPRLMRDAANVSANAGTAESYLESLSVCVLGLNRSRKLLSK